MRVIAGGTRTTQCLQTLASLPALPNVNHLGGLALFPRSALSAGPNAQDDE
jgi:hypothetical protein